jgi:hypothetical protein
LRGSSKRIKSMKWVFFRSDKKPVELVWLALIFIVALVLRFWMLGYSPFRSDTMNFYQAALREQSIPELWENPPWMNQIPLCETLCLLPIKGGLPATPFMVRWPFALMGIVTIFFVWRFARRWFGAGAALFVLVLAGLNPYQIYFSRMSYYYAGVLCSSAVLFVAFWSLRETLQKQENPTVWRWASWFLAAAVACHMHMSVWGIAGLQGVLLLLCGWRLKGVERSRFLLRFLTGAILLSALMLRWVIRAVQEIFKVTAEGGTGHYGASARSEFARLFPAYFTGESLMGVAWLLLFVALTAVALFRTSEELRRFRTLAWIGALHFAVMMLYVGAVGGGVAKIAYFSAIWPHFILLMGIGAYRGVQIVKIRSLRLGLVVLLAGGYAALTVVPAWAIVHLEGKPTPFYKINDWVSQNLPPGTPILTDRWFEPWNELAVHNPGDINYTFTVPDEPLETYRQLNWPATAERFFENHPDAAFLELCPDRYEKQLGLWTFPQRHFAHVVAITNDAAMTLRRWKVFPQDDFATARTNRVVVHLYYNTPEDLLAAARRENRAVLRLYGEGWGYAKPGWQQGYFEDYRTFTRAASIDLYNLKETPLSGTLELSAAAAAQPKSVALHGNTTVFAPGRLRGWSVPLTLQPGRNTLSFSSPSTDPLFVLDLRWKPAAP